MKIGIDKATGFSYFFIHFSIEVLCFFVLGRLFTSFSAEKWIAYLIFDVLAFATQPFIGTFLETHPRWRIGLWGNVMLIVGAIVALALHSFFIPMLIGLGICTLGNACMHISGAVATARASEGRLSEPALFVGGGSFGVITGRMLALSSANWIIAFAPACVSILLIALTDRRIKKKYGASAYDFVHNPVKHNISRNRKPAVVVAILFLIVVARGYIGYGLPTGWSTLGIHTVLLFVFMGLGKVLGGVLSDIFGPRKVGFFSCIVALPVLLLSDKYMWPSLVGIAMFSMTMAITLGGLYSVMKYTPAVAFGATTVALLIGSAPIFFMNIPSQLVCNVLNIVMSILSFGGIWYCIKDNTDKE